MKKPLFFAALWAICAPGLAQTTPAAPAADSKPEAVRVAAFRGDRAGAISYTFDDGLRSHYRLALPLLQEAGLKGTFYIVPGRVVTTKEEADAKEAKKPGEQGAITWDEIREIAAQGHEIGNHAWSHAPLTKIEVPKIEEEVTKADEKLQEETGLFPISFCYPGNGRNDQAKAIVDRAHVAREFQNAMGQGHAVVDCFNAWANRQATEGTWGVAMIHNVADNGGYDPLPPGLFKAHLAYVKDRADLWVDTFGNVARYVRERDAAQLKIAAQADRSVTFTIDTPLPKPFFSVPLTVVVNAPGATAAEAKTANGQTLPATVAGDSVRVECPPSPEAITVTWKSK